MMMAEHIDFPCFLDRFLSRLQRRGLRPTQQRRTICGLVCTIESPFTAEQLIDLSKLLRPESRVSRPTVYRTLNELVNTEIVQRCDSGRDTTYTRVSG